MRWIDYRSKYGIAYLTSTNYLGVNFNDDTKLIGQVEDTEIVYLKEDCYEIEKGQIIKVNLCQRSLLKKCTLYKYFRFYF